MFRVFLTNHDYFAQDLFDSFDEALAWVKKTCFEVSIWNDGKRLATWSPMTGLSYDDKEMRNKAMGRMKDEHHETICKRPARVNPAEADYYAEQRRHAQNKTHARQIPIAKPIPTPYFEGRREYLADPATDAKRFEQACREADIEAKKKGMNIVVFKNRENNYFTWEEKYISSANPIEALYTAQAPEAK